MRKYNDEAAPVGVVPRRHARSIEPLMGDSLEACTVADTVDRPGAAKKSIRLPSPPQWLSYVGSLGIVAAALEWLKLTR